MAYFRLHQDLGLCVRQAQPHQPPTHEHSGGQQDGDGFGDADEGAEYQVPKDGGGFAECIQEAKACCPAKKTELDKTEKRNFQDSNFRCKCSICPFPVIST